MASLTIYVKKEDYVYMLERGLSGSELFRSAIELHERGEIITEKGYLFQIQKKNEAIEKLNQKIQELQEKIDNLEGVNMSIWNGI